MSGKALSVTVQVFINFISTFIQDLVIKRSVKFINSSDSLSPRKRDREKKVSSSKFS